MKIPFSLTECVPDGKCGEQLGTLYDCWQWTLGRGSKMGSNYANLLGTPSPPTRRNGKKVGRPRKYPKGE